MTDHETQQARESVYGDFTRNMTGTSQQIAGVLTQMYANGQMTISKSGRVDLPEWFAPLIMGLCVKGNRMASGNHHEDNFVDARIYLDKAAEMQR